MTNATDGMTGYAFPIFVGVGLPGVVGVWLVTGGGLSGEVLVIVTLVYAVVLVSSVLHVSKAGRQYRRVPRFGPIDFSQSNLNPAYSIPGVDSDYTLTITDVIEDCPQGLKAGDTARIDSLGNLSRPLCRCAAGAVGDALLGMNRNERSPVQLMCYCPATDRGLTFQLIPAAHSA